MKEDFRAEFERERDAEYGRHMAAAPYTSGYDPCNYKCRPGCRHDDDCCCSACNLLGTRTHRKSGG